MSLAGEPTAPSGQMPILDHLEELRSRLIKSGVAVIFGMVTAYLCLEPLMNFIMLPAGKLYYMKPAEAFFVYVKISLAGGMLIALPLILYQIFAFLLPAFSLKSRRVLLELVFGSAALVVGGIAFAYYFVLPLGLKFFMGFASQIVEPIISMESYLDLFFMLTLPFGFIFNMPLVLILLAKIGVITSEGLRRGRKVVIFFIFLAAAILTPPDAVSQIMLAVPMLGLYELSILVIAYICQK